MSVEHALAVATRTELSVELNQHGLSALTVRMLDLPFTSAIAVDLEQVAVRGDCLCLPICLHINLRNLTIHSSRLRFVRA